MHHTLFNNKLDIEAWLQTHGVQDYTINPDMSIDVNDDVDLMNKNLQRIAVQFNHVKGSFNCNNNFLTSLLGAPYVVDAGFYCSYNQLTSLKFCPASIELSFLCSHNQLRSLEHCPGRVMRDFKCNHNQIRNLEFCPDYVGLIFNCSNNPLLGRAQDIKIFEKIKMLQTETLIRIEQERLQHQLLLTAPSNIPTKTHKI